MILVALFIVACFAAGYIEGRLLFKDTEAALVVGCFIAAVGAISAAVSW